MINGTLVPTLLNLFDTIEHEKYNFDGYWTFKKAYVIQDIIGRPWMFNKTFPKTRNDLKEPCCDMF